MYEIITKKKRGEELSREEIERFVFGYSRGEIPDYQASALLMAICLRGMSEAETVAMTLAITASGRTVDLSRFSGRSVDKHSTGGVGDKTTLIVAPIAATLGCPVAKMSGRGLGHTGGTVDKLESIPGYRTSLDSREFLLAVKKTGIAVVGQSGNLAPADKKLYALRDVTATVDSVPLIASSVMGKKLAAGAKTIVLDVKYGSGAFMNNAADAETLATKMVEIGKKCGRNVAALITNMDTPLGYMIGNIMEVKEAIETLHGRGPDDFTEVCLSLASAMVHLALGVTLEEARKMAEGAIADGSAFKKFVEWIGEQGGDSTLAENPDNFPVARYEHSIRATRDGYIAHMNAEKIGLASVKLGAGRITKDDVIDFTAGIKLIKKTGDAVKCGDVIAILYTNNEKSIEAAENEFLSGVKFGDEAQKAEPLVYKTVS